VERLIQVSGFAVEAYASAEDFLANAAIRYPGCLLLDVRLPDIDGLSLQKSLRENGCYLPIVFMTGHGDIPMSVNAIKNGAINFLPKPFKLIFDSFSHFSCVALSDFNKLRFSTLKM
jgi:FixJ family two-component response regulator